MKAFIQLMLALGAVCATATGCTLIANLDRFDEVADAGGSPAGSSGGSGKGGSSGKGGAGKGGSGESDAGGNPPEGDAGLGDVGCGNPRTLCLQVKNFSPHLDELVQADLVTNADNTLRARAILDPLGVGSADADIVMPLAIPENEVPDDGEDHPLHLEIYADQNKDGMYTVGEDHDWNVELPASGTIVFPHNSQFSTLDPAPRGQGTDFHMHFSEMDVHVGAMLEVMVIQVLDETHRSTVGLYRLQEVPSATFDIVIPDIIDPGNISYVVEFYADTNKNRKYDGPPLDHAWIRSGESGEEGLFITFVHAAQFMELTFQFPFEEQ